MSLTPLAIVGAMAGQIYGASQAEKAARQAAERTQALAQPYLDMGSWALPQLRSAVTNYLAPYVGQESPFLESQHEQTLAAIGRTEQQNLGAVNQYWGATGNMGRARGEQLRTRESAANAVASENTHYGLNQESYKRQTLGDYMNVLQSGVNIGSKGLDLVVGVNQQKGAATENMWDQIGGSLGWGFGAMQGAQNQASTTAALRDIYGRDQGPNSGTEGGSALPKTQAAMGLGMSPALALPTPSLTGTGPNGLIDGGTYYIDPNTGQMYAKKG